MNEEELDAADLAPPTWAVPGWLPEGFCVFAGPRKLGKSCLIADVGQAVASGDSALGVVPTSETPGEGHHVIHIGYEEGLYELQSRFRKLRKARGGKESDKLHIYDDWPGVNDGGLERLENMIKDLEPRLVTIDVLRKFQTTAGSYSTSSARIDLLTEFALKYHVAIVGVTHFTKGIGAENDDWTDRIIGSSGITGSARTIWGLARRRNAQGQGVLRMTGKSIGDQNIPLRWEPDKLLWTAQLEEDAPPPQMVELPISDERKQILTFVRLNAGADANQIAKGIGKSYDNVYHLLWQMLKRGQLLRFGTEYLTPEQAAQAHEEPSPQIEFPQGARGW